MHVTILVPIPILNMIRLDSGRGDHPKNYWSTFVAQATAVSPNSNLMSLDRPRTTKDMLPTLHQILSTLLMAKRAAVDCSSKVSHCNEVLTTVGVFPLCCSGNMQMQRRSRTKVQGTASHC